ncbi:Serine/threonine-protein kinase EDR1-like protein [Drosera capensis]
MSKLKMKQLLRKLHIGTDHNHNNSNNHNNSSHRSTTNLPDRTPTPSPSPSPASSSGSGATEVRDSSRGEAGAIAGGGVGGDGLNFLEEEFQVQLALALSASSDSALVTAKDVESEQIKAAKELSLEVKKKEDDVRWSSCDVLSLSYWNSSVVHYDEKVLDGFYDVYGIASNLIVQGELPFLVGLQALSMSQSSDYEVISVDRTSDYELRNLEKRAFEIFMDCEILGCGLALHDLIQQIADLVVDQMGDPVGNAKEMTTRWRIASNEQRSSLDSAVLPLGRLNVGLSRHRALLFKVLADRIDLPCMLVKGSLYTGTDDGAVNLIKTDDGSEYIIDLMGAPGALIPAEVPSSLLLGSALGARCFPATNRSFNKLDLLLDKVPGPRETAPDVSTVVEACLLGLDDATVMGCQSKKNNESFSRDFDQSKCSSHKTATGAGVGTSLVKEQKVKDVSKYVISAAKNPEFAQKLHAVLLESGASPPPDLFSDILPEDSAVKKLIDNTEPECEVVDSCTSSTPIKDQTSSELSLLSSSPMQLFELYSYNDGPQNRLLESIGMEIDRAMISSPTFPKSNYCNVGDADIRVKQIISDSVVGISRIPVVASNKKATASHKVLDEWSLSDVDSSKTQVENYDNILNDIDYEKVGSSAVMDTAKCSLATSYVIGECIDHVSVEISPMLREIADWEIHWEDLRIGDRIGIGSHGEVYHADWNGTEVAVKKFLFQNLSEDVLIQFRSEAELMIRLNHPNVVLFKGAVNRPPNLSILTEFLPRGSLYKLLHRSSVQIDENMRMKMALDVAKGMNYLHTSHPTIVHRDLKSPNLLVDKNWVVKVCDFGMSRTKHHTFLSSKSIAGTAEWMAPEVLRNEPSSEKCDVYSFGVILWELVTLRIPWMGLNSMQVVGAVGFKNDRLQIPDEVDPIVSEIIRDCWENDPNLRPSFSQLMTRLRGLKCLIVQSNQV